MGTGQEKRFDYGKYVSDLKQFLKSKKRQLEDDIIRRTISDTKIETAKKYIGIIENVLKSGYFARENLGLKVYELMETLKADDIVHKKEEEELERKLRRMQRYLNASNEELMAVREYGIPDEFEIHEASVISMKRELLSKIEAVEAELERCKYGLKQCRNLKGMVCKPDGFYNAVYK